MESTRNPRTDQVIITLTHEDCLTLMSGTPLVDRENPFDPSAKVEVRSMGELDPTYQWTKPLEPGFANKLGGLVCKGRILGNNDIQVFVPLEIPALSYIAAEDIAAKNIEGDPEIVPSGGIRIEFGPIGAHNRERSEAFAAEDAVELEQTA